MIWRVLGIFLKTLTPHCNRVKDGRDVTFMNVWVKPLYISCPKALDLPQNLFRCQERVP